MVEEHRKVNQPPATPSPVGTSRAPRLKNIAWSSQYGNEITGYTYFSQVSRKRATGGTY